MTRTWLLAFTVLACGPGASPTSTPTTLVVGSASAAPIATTPAAREFDRVACPVMPLEIVLTGVDKPITVLSLDERGTVTSPMVAAMNATSGAVGVLDTNGCLVDDKHREVVADASTSGSVWTAYTTHAIDPKTGRLDFGGGGRRMNVEANGDIVWYDASGAREASTTGTFSVKGYRPAAACASRVLVVTFLAMMPSMAHSDGNPPRVPPPAGSKCPHAKR